MHGFEAASDLTTSEWASFLAGELQLDGLVAPPLPDPDFQRMSVGDAGLGAMIEAGKFYDRVIAFSGTVGRLLDFGCGWGRIYRTFLRDSPDIVGADVDSERVEMSRAAMPYGSFVQCDPLPPLDFPAGAFQTITAYSVFSHLAEQPLLAWLHEFRRMLQPGGFVAFTTLKLVHLDVWERGRTDPHMGGPLASAGFDRDAWEARADREHLYVPTGGGPGLAASFYGEAIVTRPYLESQAGRLGFEVVAFEDVPAMPQVFVALRAV